MSAETPAGPSLGNSTSLSNGTIPANSTLWKLPENPGRSLSADIIVCAVLTWMVALTFVILRFYTRCRLKRGMVGPTDWFILPALMFSAVVSASAIDQATRGIGTHVWQIKLPEFKGLEKAAWYGMLFYHLSLVFTRISILLLYRRIFTHSWATRAINVVFFLVVATGIWFVVSVFTACVPLAAFWDWSIYLAEGDVYCQPPNLWWGIAALHVASDLVIVILPMPVLATLKLPHRQKLVLVAMFGLGFFVCIISAVRLATFVNIQNGKNWDRTYTGAKIQYWSTVEVNASIVCACIMTMKPLVQKLFPTFLAGSYVRGNHSLRWITPLAGTRADDETRRSTQPMALERTTTGASLKGGSATAEDLEAQCRAGSVATDDDDEVMCSVAGMSPLRAPPRAHLRLSIQATKSVRVVSGRGATENDDDEKGSITEDDKGNRSSSPATSGWLSEAETVVVVGGKEWVDERGPEGGEEKK
ncbi:hypothetical protein B0T18DRAFT_426375 [Schizothecium vesticola]|uniref:Rhodopsin domain-containing protein n=1 Tax=Schizothecium vesticola TaxID=314040 RepID=A0AA40KA68_9PEZI|nr:hypothetical protein B0T18DRAFT_426375 [Schizothecium vesticola]